MPKLIFIQDKIPRENTDRLFVDTNIFYKIFIITEDPRDRQIREYALKFLKYLVSQNKQLFTTTGIIQETSFKIIDTLVRLELKRNKTPVDQIRTWTHTFYKKDKNIIEKHLPIVNQFKKFVEKDYGITICNDDYRNGHKLIETYKLLPRDAYFLAKAIENKSDIFTYDTDFRCVKEINKTFIPLPKKLT